MVNKIHIGDCLDILKTISEETIDLIYIDPPFFTQKSWIGEAGYFEDKFEDLDHYLNFIYTRVSELHRVLKSTGSLYLHCDTHASHYIKIILDDIFGIDKFRNEIIWCYKTGGVPKSLYAKKHDTIFMYTKSDKYTFNQSTQKSYVKTLPEPHTESGKKLNVMRDEFCDRCGSTERGGKYRMVTMRDVWDDIDSLFRNSQERNGYPTQKPLKLLKRIIESSSNSSDIVLDPMCGSGTTLKAAQLLNRNWIGIDISEKAISLSESITLN